MPIARFEMPDGKIARFEVPTGTTPDQAQQMVSQYVKTSPLKAASKPPIDINTVVWDDAPSASRPPIDPATITWDSPISEEEEFEFRLRHEREQNAGAPTRAQKQPEKKPSVWEGLSPLTALSALGPVAVALGLPLNAKQVADVNGGMIRGAGSIGSTLLAPLDMLKDMQAGKGVSLESNRARRADIDGGLRSLGADPDAMAYKGGKIAAEIAGTAGVGGLFAKGATMAGASPSLASSLATGGLNVTGRTGLAGLGTRALGGAVTGGATAGMINPEDAGIGAVAGGAFPLVTKAGGTAAGGIKSLVEPLYSAGQEKIVGRALHEFSGGQADDAIRNLQAARELVPGSLPTVGEAAKVPSLAALQRAAMNTSPESANALEARFASNNQARVDILESLAGSPSAREAAETARDQAAASAYTKARQDDALRRAAAILEQQNKRDAGVGLGSLANQRAMPAADAIKPSAALVALSKRPAMQGFIAEARRLAANKGQPIGNPLESIDGLHYVKLAVDDALKGTPGNALARNQKAAVMDIKNLLVAEMDKVSPVYAQSRKAYQEASKPINQMDIGDELLKTVKALTGRIQPAQFASKLTDETAKRATGFNKATLAKTLTPEQLAALNAVRDDLARAEFAQNAGRGVGSNTAQNLAYSNMLNQVGIPDFMRSFSGGEALGKLASRAGDVVYGKANQEIAGLLANTMLDPGEAARLMLLRDSANSALLKTTKAGLLGASRTAPVLLAQ